MTVQRSRPARLPIPEGYSAVDVLRFSPEVHSNERRTDFERDRARLVHSASLRRLSAKTQVLSPTLGIDFARNRLTHSLEVSQIGREVGKALRLSPDIVDTACLAHDIGHPPFGHNGERAINEWAVNVGGFEGNAQTLRLLTRLEPKVIDRHGRSYGLNLTRASLDASCKYPWNREEGIERAEHGAVKFGFYEDDRPVFDWFRSGAPAGTKCIEAQAMDLADDVAYSVHDFEDAVVTRLIELRQINDRFERASIIDAVVSWTWTSLSPDELTAALERLQSMRAWLTVCDDSRADLAALKNLTSKLIGRFVKASTDRTREVHGGDLWTRFNASLVVPREIEAEITVLKGIIGSFIMASGARQPFYLRQRELLHELLDALFDSNGANLERQFADDWRLAQDEPAQRRVVIDQVASLTDQTAIAWHTRLVRGGAE